MRLEWKALPLFALVTAVVCSMGTASAQDLSGSWQGTLEGRVSKLRLIFRITAVGNGWSGSLMSIDETPDWSARAPFESVTLQNTSINLKISEVGTYEGTLSNDGNSIAGTWIQGVLRSPLTLQRATPETEWKDSSPHTVRFMTVDKGVQLEVLDWGGTGRPMVFLAGLGNSAHVFDRLAPKFTSSFHVYGITRRGFGASSQPASGYSADRLGDDVLEIIDALKLNKPILVGHSIAGEELSSIGSRHADKVAGLVYLDAGYSYAYYDAALGTADVQVDVSGQTSISGAILNGRQRYTRIQGPVLAIYAFGGPDDPAAAQAQANAFERGVPQARVVRFPRALHFFFLTNEPIALNQINMFAATLP